MNTIDLRPAPGDQFTRQVVYIDRTIHTPVSVSRVVVCTEVNNFGLYLRLRGEILTKSYFVSWQEWPAHTRGKTGTTWVAYRPLT